jgi:beta propeller repeat protein
MMSYPVSKPQDRLAVPMNAWMLAAVLLVACSRNVSVDEPKDAGGPGTSDAGAASATDADGGTTNLLDDIDQLKDAGASPAADDADVTASDATAPPDTAPPTDGARPPSDATTDTSGAATSDAAVAADGTSVTSDATSQPSGDAQAPTTPDSATSRDTSSSTDGVVSRDTLAATDTLVAADTASPVLITGVQVLVDGLSAIHVPAVGTERVSLLQYTSAGTAMAIHVTWDGVVGRWYESSGARHIYLAASGTHHVGLLYLASSYPVHENGGTAELSGTPATYKEFLAANDSGYAWIDYGQINGSGTGGGGSGGSGGPGGGGTSPASDTLGTVFYQTWQGSRTTLTDNLRYRARIDISNTDAAYVEYANTVAGTPGQIVVQPLAGGAASAVAPGSRHQDRPAIDGNWVVWEEYLNDTDAVIRGKNLATGETRNLSSTAGFRTNPDVRGTRVVWEDQRSGNGDIYTYDLAANDGEKIAVSGAGHSAGARLTTDGLVWIETSGNNMGLLRARWTR